MARETTKWPSTRWPITKIMSSDGCNGNRVPLEMGPWYDFREFGCHLGNVGEEAFHKANQLVDGNAIDIWAIDKPDGDRWIAWLDGKDPLRIALLHHDTTAH